MVRLVGVDLPRNKRVAYALTYIHGLGLTSAKKIIELVVKGVGMVLVLQRFGNLAFPSLSTSIMANIWQISCTN